MKARWLFVYLFNHIIIADLRIYNTYISNIFYSIKDIYFKQLLRDLKHPNTSTSLHIRTGYIGTEICYLNLLHLLITTHKLNAGIC